MQTIDHRINQRLVRKLNRTAKGVPEKFATELAEKIIAPGGHKIGAKAFKAGNLLAARQLGSRVDREAGRVFLARPADGIEALQRELAKPS